MCKIELTLTELELMALGYCIAAGGIQTKKEREGSIKKKWIDTLGAKILRAKKIRISQR
jgi:hypothetical protein